MARNGSGIYTKVNTFVSSNPITASAHNANWDDLALEITNSVAADGQTTMTAPLKASNGSASLPAYTFGSDPDTGAYRIDANRYGIGVAGAKVVEVNSGGLAATGDLAASGVIKQAGFQLIPVGFGPVPWSGTTAPSGWVLAGATYSRATYAALWAFAQTEIAGGNTFYTNGDGSTNFTIATMEGYVPAGTDSGAARIASFTNVGDLAGASARTLTTANLPAYTPAGTNSTGIAQLSYASANSYNTAGATKAISDIASGGGLGTVVNVATNAQTFTGTPQGGTSTSFGIVQPSRAFKFIIFAGA
jgi:microcystin-dependent protein